MRCCGPPTTPRPAPPAVSTAALAEALLFREILRPLGAALGPVGELALSGAVERVLLGGGRR